MNKLLSTYRFAFDQTFERLMQRDPNRFRFHVFFTIVMCLISWFMAFFTFYGYATYNDYTWDYVQLFDVKSFDITFQMLGGAVVLPLVVLVGFHRIRSKMHDGATVSQVFAKIPITYWVAYVGFTLLCALLNVTSYSNTELQMVFGMEIPFDPNMPMLTLLEEEPMPFLGFRWEILTYLPYLLTGMFLLVTRKSTVPSSMQRWGVKLLAFLILAIVLHGGFSLFNSLIYNLFSNFFLSIFTDYFVPIFLLNITVFFLLALWMQYSGYLHWLIFEDAESFEQEQELNEPDLLDQ